MIYLNFASDLGLARSRQQARLSRAVTRPLPPFTDYLTAGVANVRPVNISP